jgi:uncharacterized protein YcbK (DUF882 family)
MTSPHFSERELACHHCGVSRVIPELVAVLEAIREVVGRPLIVRSAYRCPEYNAAAGGAPDSQHVHGRAADISVLGMTARELYRIAAEVPGVKGLGVDDAGDYLHVDVRERETLARWCYGTGGRVVPFYET